MAAGLKLRDVDHGFDDLKKRVFGATKPRLSVGILERDGAEPHKGGDEGVTVADVAGWMEFGTVDEQGREHVPARSFLRAWYDENREKIRDDLRKLMVSVVNGKRTKEQILQLLGMRAVGRIQQRIAAGIPPELAESTVERKGSSVPLIDTGQLRSSISFRVEPDSK